MGRLSATAWTLILILLLLLAWAAAAEACWTGFVVAVVDVVDGDTAKLELAIWVNLAITETIRLVGVDTPEKADLVGWTAAKAFTEAWLAGSGYTEVTGCKRDSFGRLLGVVKSRQKGDLASALLLAGHAVPYERK